MSREREQRREEIASQLNQALGAAAELMTQRIEAASTIRHAHPVPSGRRARRLLRGRLHGWLVPLAAAAAVAVIVVGSVLTSRTHFGATRPSSTTGVPAFYLTVNTKSTGAQPRIVQHTWVEVHRSSGAVTGTVLPPSGWQIQAISAAADDRTFFVAESFLRQEGSLVCQTDRFLRLSVTAAGRPAGLRQVGVQVHGYIAVLAASPEGTRLAYTGNNCPTAANPGPVWELHIMNLASGAISTWTNAVTAANPADVAQVTAADALAWTADGRSLSVAYQWMPSAANETAVAVLLLNTDSESGTVQAHSRVIWHQSRSCARPCVFNAEISPGGNYLIASAAMAASVPYGSLDLLERLALPSGRLTTVLYRTTIVIHVQFLQVLPLNGDGSDSYWLVSSGGRLGWVSEGQFHPLQPGGSVEAAAW